MNRLTKRNSNGGAYMAIADRLSKRDQELEGSKTALEGILAIFQKLAAYEDTELEPEELQEFLKRIDIKDLHDHISELLRLEEQGRLIKLPCKVNDVVYAIDAKGNVHECKVYNITTNVYAKENENSPHWVGFEIKSDIFGKTVFLTKEEAEKAWR